MYVIEKQAAYNINDNTEICSLSEDTTHAEILNWLNCTVEEWNGWYSKYSEGELEIGCLTWHVLRSQFGDSTKLEDLQTELQDFLAVVTPGSVEEIFYDLIQYEDNTQLLQLAGDSIMLEMLRDLEYAVRTFFPNAPVYAVENILFKA